MIYPFPPPPAGYSIVLIVRWALVVWSVIGVAILVRRIWNWTLVQKGEYVRWLVGAMLCIFVGLFGFCRDRFYDNNAWNYAVITATISVCLAAVALQIYLTYIAHPVGF